MISIIIPTRNEEKALAKTIASLKELTLPHEIIITDGGSTDSTVALAKTLVSTVVEYPKDRKQTIASNRNFGASIAQGEYLVFIDCDCVIPDINTFFTTALQHFETDPKLVGLTGWVMTQPELETWADKLLLGSFNWTYVLMNNYLGIGAAVGKFQMMRMKAFKQTGGYSEYLVSGEDHDMFKKLTKVGKTRLDRHLHVYHSNRRAHAIGWPKLLWIWTKDTIFIVVKGKALSKDWTNVR